MKSKILIIEDDIRMRRIMQLLLEGNGYTVNTAGDGLQGMALWRDWSPDAVISDIKMPGADGLQVLDFKIREALPAPLILLTAFGTIDMAVRAIKKGAYDYIAKPFDNTQFLEVIARALSWFKAQTNRDNGRIHPDIAGDIEMIGSSPVMNTLRVQITTVAAAPTSVLITGESGTGKELVGRAIHDQSRRRQERLIKVNCASIPKELLESELFGHLKGAFTGAVSDRIGAFANAHEGTLFLDEIGDLPLDLQPKLLHAVEEKIVSPIGGDRRKTVDVKIISATNRDLHQMVTKGLFRNDLFYRLNTFHIHVPPLRERQEDIALLAGYFLKRFSRAYQRDIRAMAESVLQCMVHYQWPGNVRELRNVVERAVLSCRESVITDSNLPQELLCFQRQTDVCVETNPFDLEGRERQLIRKALQECAGNQMQASRLLKISRNTLRYRMKKYAIAVQPEMNVGQDPE